MPAEGNGARAPIFERVESLRRALRGVDHAAAPALPLGEALHPATLAAVLVLIVNDWVLKPWLGPGLVTGKLSDLAGLAFAPVVLSAAIGLVLHLAARLGARIDPSLSRARLLACIAATGAVFAAVKLDPAAARLLAALISRLGRPAAIYLDPTDLLCLPALAISAWIGRDELRRIPLGRPAAIHRLGRPAGPALADARWAGAPADRLSALAAAIDAWQVPVIDGLLRA
ncbi:MAG TPA: hypothetical protein VFK02_33880 [Kofleriaceae bacterium]|nr:hypothetical protein [Kofleriaceae bacterium]